MQKLLGEIQKDLGGMHAYTYLAFKELRVKLCNQELNDVISIRCVPMHAMLGMLCKHKTCVAR